VKPGDGTVAVPPAAAKFLKPVIAEANKRGIPLYIVGGPVRDWILKRSTFDLDLTVVGDPDPIADLCAKIVGGKVEAFGRFGTRRVIGRSRFRIDVATTRAERYAEPAALPELTATGVTIEQDLLRRDFTINAMALRLDDDSRKLVDPYGGQRDLKARTLRVLHPASFRDDPTRVFRAARFLARLRYKPADGMGGEAKDVLKLGEAAKLSRHRLLHELLCLLGEENPSLAFGLLEMWGYLGLLYPELPWQMKLPDGVEPRLAAMALALGPVKGADFVESFPFEHGLRGELLETLALGYSDKAPRAAPSKLAAAAVRRAFPKLSSVALKPCFVRGADLIKLGRKPGPEFQAALDGAAKLQRLGKLKTRPAALSWLTENS
jgi:tRNA nucleotidyltransferase (CCA-adding enzyme)